MPDENRKIPMVALRGLVIFPYMVLNFEVGRNRSIAALERAMTHDQEIFLATQKDLRVETPEGEDIYPVGVVAKIRQILKVPGDALRVLVEGLYRAEIVEYLSQGEEGIEVEVRECERDLPEDDLSLIHISSSLFAAARSMGWKK